MKLILFGCLICVLSFCVKSETQCIEYDKIRALVREEIQNFQNPKISNLESMVMTMNEYSNRQDGKIRIQNGQIHEQERRIQIQEIQIRNLQRQVNEVGNQIAKSEGKSNSKERKKQSVVGSKVNPFKHTEARDFMNNSSHSFIDYALRQSVKSMSKEKTGNRKDRSSFTKRLGLNDNIVAFYGYMSNGEAHPGQHQILVFDVAKTNVGLSLNQHSGMFTAPVPGVYVFTWTVVSGKHSYIYSQLVINSDLFGAIQTDSDEIGDFHAVTGTVVAELNQGDDVFIRTHPTNSIRGVIVSQDDMRTSFSGWKLQ